MACGPVFCGFHILKVGGRSLLAIRIYRDAVEVRRCLSFGVVSDAPSDGICAISQGLAERVSALSLRRTGSEPLRIIYRPRGTERLDAGGVWTWDVHEVSLRERDSARRRFYSTLVLIGTFMAFRAITIPSLTM